MRVPKQRPLALGGGLFLVGVLCWFLHYLASGTLERNVMVVGMVTGVAGTAIAAATLGLNILQERHARAAAGIGEAEQRARAVETLAKAVRRQWEEEANVRMLRRPTPLRLHWWTTERPVAPSAATIVGDAIGGRVTKLRFHGHSEEVGEKFAALPRRRLVILGRPGAGKTVLAVLLTLDLLDRWHPGDPVPVLLSVSTWDPTKEHLHTWIARRLVEDYPALGSVAAYGPAAALRLVVSGDVLAVLDGLDEMPPGLRAIAIGELDRAHADRPLVLTCRSEEYEEAVTTSGELLAAAAAVELLPVSVDEAIRFLQRAIAPEDTRWEEVFGQLRADPDGALAAALSSPLMVALARTIYAARDREPGTLVAIAAAGGQAAVERHLLDNLIPAVYAHRPPAPGLPAPAVRPRWGPGPARRYLAFLARHLHERDARELAWWDLHLAMPVPVRLGLGVILGFVLAPVAVLVVVFLPSLVGPVLGLLAWLIVVLWFVRGKKPSPSRVSFRIRGRMGELAGSIRRPLAVFLVLGLLAGYLITVAFAFTLENGGILLWLVFGLLFGLAGGLGVGLVGWLRRPADYALAVTPQSVLKSDRIVAPMVWFSILVFLGVMVGLVFWFLLALDAQSESGEAFPGGFISELLRSFWLGFLVALYVWLIGGPVAALVFTAWGWFVITRSWLALRGRLPWQLMTFLEDAHHRGVLRQTGATYQFRHARLQEHLATQPIRSGVNGTPVARPAGTR